MALLYPAAQTTSGVRLYWLYLHPNKGIVKKHCVYMMHTMERELDLHFLDAIFFRNACDFEDAEWSRLIDERVQEFGISTEEAFQQLKAMKAKNAETSSAAKASDILGSHH